MTMFSKLKSSKALKCIGLSALKAFAAAAIPLVGAGLASVTTFDAAKALAVSAVIAGLDAAFKAVQIALEA